MNITFSSIEYASGETVPIEAVAADMSLAAIKGKVTGKQSGKSLMVRSLSGQGETAAMIVGAPSANSAFSENDMLRMRLADNIGKIYLIFAKSQALPASHETSPKVETTSLPATQ
jgi:hypothetical protein